MILPTVVLKLTVGPELNVNSCFGEECSVDDMEIDTVIEGNNHCPASFGYAEPTSC